MRKPLAHAKLSGDGPVLLVGGRTIRSWQGSAWNEQAQELASHINAAIEAHCEVLRDALRQLLAVVELADTMARGGDEDQRQAAKQAARRALHDASPIVVTEYEHFVSFSRGATFVQYRRADLWEDDEGVWHLKEGAKPFHYYSGSVKAPMTQAASVSASFQEALETAEEEFSP